MILNFISAAAGTEEDGEFSPESLRTWLNSLSAADVTGGARVLIDRLVDVNRADLQSRLRLRLLDMFRDHVDWLLPQLESRIARAQPPLSGSLRQIAYLIEKLLKELASGYSRAVLRVPRAWLSLGFKGQLHVPLTRAMDFHARRLQLSQRLYARNPGGVWSELHQLYQVARDWGIAEREIEAPQTSPLRVYRDALLLAFAQPTKLMHGDFLRVQAYLAANADLAELTIGGKVEDPLCIFAVDPRRDRPGVAYAKRADAGYDNGALLLLTHPLVERLQTQLKKLHDGVPPATLGLPEESARLGYQELMQRLITHWRGERKARATRMRFHPRVELWVGLREIWRVLRAESPQDTPAADITQREAPARASEWIIANESSRGFALKYMSGSLPPINVGEIVAIKGKDRGAVYVCLVRWILSNTPEHFELGLQQLAPVVVPAVYKPAQPDRAAPEPILFFPEMPAQKRAPAVVVPPNRLRSNEAFSLRHRRGRLELRASRVIEKTPSVELIEVFASQTA
jgi:cyclic-di-GMP-binding protein